MLPFRSEIRNSPTKQTVKIFLTDESLDERIKNYLETIREVDFVEIRITIGRNRADENITVFFKDNVDINKMKASIDASLWWYFESEYENIHNV